jgi:hypothetical protein
MTAITLWGVGAVYFSPLLPARWRAVAAASYGTASLVAFALLPSPGRTAVAALALFTVLVSLFLRIPASNDRDWQPEVSMTPHATVHGDLVTIRGVRNFDYRSESDYTPRWEERTYDLRKLDAVDIGYHHDSSVNIHIPTDLVVDQWTPDVESRSHLDFLWLHNLWTTSCRLRRPHLTSTISMA